MSTSVVRYALDDGTVVEFEIEPSDTYRPVGRDGSVGRLREALEPAVQGAKEVLDRVQTLRPDKVEVRVGIKVSGTATWIVARTASEGNFEIVLTWESSARSEA